MGLCPVLQYEIYCRLIKVVTMCILMARDVKRTVHGSAKGSQTMLLDRACGKTFHETVHDFISVMNNQGFIFNVKKTLEVCSVDGEVFVHPRIGDVKHGVIGALSYNYGTPGFSDLWTGLENSLFSHYSYYVKKFSNSRLKKNPNPVKATQEV